jgi:hypothetical protein
MTGERDEWAVRDGLDDALSAEPRGHPMQAVDVDLALLAANGALKLRQV